VVAELKSRPPAHRGRRASHEGRSRGVVLIISLSRRTQNDDMLDCNPRRSRLRGSFRTSSAVRSPQLQIRFTRFSDRMEVALSHQGEDSPSIGLDTIEGLPRRLAAHGIHPGRLAGFRPRPV